MGIEIEVLKNYFWGIGISLITGGAVLYSQEKKLNPKWLIFIGALFLAIASFMLGYTYM